MGKKEIMTKMLQLLWDTYKQFHPGAWGFCLTIYDSEVRNETDYEFWETGNERHSTKFTIKKGENNGKYL